MARSFAICWSSSVSSRLLKFSLRRLSQIRFEAVTIGRTDVGGAFGRLGAWVADEFEQALSLDRIQIVLVFRGTVTNGRDLFRRRLTRFRLRAHQWQRGRYDGDRQQISCRHYPHRVFSKISRPISMRRISLVPAPIS
jgi:hypothetical protein